MASPSQPEGPYDVFLSFRGPHTRHTIISHIYRDLDRGGIHTFIDNQKLKKGKPLSPAFPKAIEESRIAVIVFSRDFASSSWCLKEAAKIMECKETHNLVVLPVFYYVDPNEVREGREEYRKAFDKHANKKGVDLEDVNKWKQALKDAGSLYGSEFNVWTVAENTPVRLESRDFEAKAAFRNGTSIKTGGQFQNEAELVESIVREIWIQLNPIPSDVAKFPVGLGSRVDELILKFNMKSQEEILRIGLCSMGGMGKTTLARALYNTSFKDFQGSAYVDGIKGTSKETEKMVLLQKKLPSQMLIEKEISLNSDAAGSSLIKKRLCRKRVLLILDGVDDMCQIDSLAKEHDWFGRGSKIIITTTNENLLKVIGARIHGVQCLDNREARELFMKHASGNGNRKTKIRGDLVDKVLQYTQRLPLALEVLGRAFAASEENEWKSKLDDFAETLTNPSIKCLE